MNPIVARKPIRDFSEKHKNCALELNAWYHTTKAATWQTPVALKNTFPTASILREGRVVFNIKGSAYRLVVRTNYQKQWIYVRFIGTHQEYDMIDANTV